jgi:ABC-type uncharacterized transport system ATPase subunit
VRPVLEVKDLTAPALHGVSFSGAAGEVVGIAGVAGNGQTELLEAIVGMIPARGSLRIAVRKQPPSMSTGGLRSGSPVSPRIALAWR